jgi:tetratricopeptide (TPR) repeat protein
MAIVTQPEADETPKTPEEWEKRGDYYADKDDAKATRCYKQALELKRCNEEAMRSDLICLRIRVKFSGSFAFDAAKKFIDSPEKGTDQLNEAYQNFNKLGDFPELDSVWDWEDLKWKDAKVSLTIGKGAIAVFLEKFNEAVGHLRQINSDDIADGEKKQYYYFYAGLAHQGADSGSIDEAIKNYDAIITNYKGDEQDDSELFFLVYYFRGLALTRAGKYQPGLESLTKAGTFTASSVELVINLLTSESELLLQLKDYQAAEERNKKIVKLFDNSLQLRPDKSADNIILNNKGVALFNLGLYHDALKYFDKALEESKENYPEAWLNKAAVIYKFGRYEEALKYFDKALEESKENYPEAWLSMALCNLFLQDYAKAREYSSKAIKYYFDKAGPENEGHKQKAILYTGIARYYEGNYRDAIYNLIDVKDSELKPIKHHYMGLCFYGLGMYEEAEKEFKAALGIDEDAAKESKSRMESTPLVPPTTYYNLAVTYSKQGKLEAAKQILKADKKSDYSKQAYAQIEKLGLGGQTDWYDWWFRTSGSKKVIGGLVIFLIASFLAIIAVGALVGNINNPSGSESSTTNGTNILDFIGFSNMEISQSILLIVVVVLLIAILLLPSLKRVKIGEVEFETLEGVSGSSKELESLSSVISDLPLTSSKEFLKYAKVTILKIFKKALESSKP